MQYNFAARISWLCGVEDEKLDRQKNTEGKR